MNLVIIFFRVISICHCVVFRVLKSCTTISYGKNLEFLKSHEIFHVLYFLRMETCTVLYYTQGYDCNPTYSILLYMSPYVENTRCEIFHGMSKIPNSCRKKLSRNFARHVTQHNVKGKSPENYYHQVHHQFIFFLCATLSVRTIEQICTYWKNWLQY